MRSHSRLFCHGDQYQAVFAMLTGVGLVHWNIQLHPIRSRHEMAGLEGATFVYVENHAKPVPHEMLIAARAYGFIEMKLNDEALRARRPKAEARSA